MDTAPWQPAGSNGARVVAGLIDLVPVGLASVALADWDGAQLTLSGAPFVLAVLLVLGYPFVSEALTGTTFGKAVLGLGVVDRDGRRSDVRAIAVRTALRIVDAIPFLYLVGTIVMFATPTKQRVGDLVAKTFVVARRELPAAPARPAWHVPFLVVLAVGMSAVGAVGTARTFSAGDRLGSFDLDGDVEPYAVGLANGIFAELDAGAIEAEMVEPFASSGEIPPAVAGIRDLVGPDRASATLLDRQVHRDSRIVELGERRDVAEFRFDVRYANGEGVLMINVVDDDGELRVLGWNILCQECLLATGPDA